MYQNILVPTDGSAAARTASSHAVDLADLCEGQIHTLHVIDTDAMAHAVPSKTIKQLEAGQLDEHPEASTRGKNATHDVVATANEAGIEATQSIRAGRPHTEIINYARMNDIDLIVMGSRGHSGISRLLLGSTTQRVIKKTSIPVLVVDTTRPDHNSM